MQSSLPGSTGNLDGRLKCLSHPERRSILIATLTRSCGSAEGKRQHRPCTVLQARHWCTIWRQIVLTRDPLATKGHDLAPDRAHPRSACHKGARFGVRSCSPTIRLSQRSTIWRQIVPTRDPLATKEHDLTPDRAPQPHHQTAQASCRGFPIRRPPRFLS